MAGQNPLAVLRANRRVWIVGAIHSNLSALKEIHQKIASQAQFGDRLVYTGNMIGYGEETQQTLAEIMSFRRWFLSIWPYTDLEDVVYLRGRQEEMLAKMTQLHFAPNPQEVLYYVYSMGLEPVLKMYGLSRDHLNSAAEEGTNALVALTGRLSTNIRNMPGHDPFFNSLKHAAYTEDGVILCVSSGLDGEKPLQKQGDSFWWSGEDFHNLGHAYGGFCRIIRGYDPAHSGFKETAFTVTLDNGPRDQQKICAVGLDRQGEVFETFISS
ncbi:metallophosphoesterase family protein [Curvivirga aplysinae]|uniref:hypothetical protein n=1 Tax=Curvivirga aplysinae TaxID=2529852 RepID=UPI0012BB76F2|nr:hypothetical protein [Curvivirga aplysinae]MTI10354.1 hypothetical protein [Curvivirga aplysinae]